MDKVDIELAQEAHDFLESFSNKGRKILAESKFIQGGGGAYDLLYFLVMKVKPKNVVETGVASGWSTTAILTALDRLQQGELFSGDMPYKDRSYSEEAIGILVDENLKNAGICTLVLMRPVFR